MPGGKHDEKVSRSTVANELQPKEVLIVRCAECASGHAANKIAEEG
jgi:hypothetical protein